MGNHTTPPPPPPPPRPFCKGPPAQRPTKHTITKQFFNVLCQNDFKNEIARGAGKAIMCRQTRRKSQYSKMIRI